MRQMEAKTCILFVQYLRWRVPWDIKHDICKLSFSSQRGVWNHNNHNPLWTRYNEIYTCMRTRCYCMIELIRYRRKGLQPRAHAPETRWGPNKKRHRMTPHLLQPYGVSGLSITIPVSRSQSRFPWTQKCRVPDALFLHIDTFWAGPARAALTAFRYRDYRMVYFVTDHYH